MLDDDNDGDKMNGRDQNCTMIYTKEVMNPYIQPFNGNIDAVETEAWLD